MVGDVVVINVHNSLGNQSTSLHFHGLFMNGSSHMDGTSYVSQCAIEPGARFTYDFTVQQPGTYWYHSHSKSQYPDGLRGLLIINDPASPYREQYDEEIIISLSDWYHTQTPDLLKLYGAMRDPSPDANLINDAADAKVHIQAGKTYLVRIANIGAFIGQYFWIENHVMKVVEVDGVYTDPVETNMLFVGTGQRYAFLLTIEEGLATNVPMITRMDESSFSMHSVRPESIDGKAWLTIDPELSFPDAQSPKGLHALNDMSLVPLDHEPLLEAVDQSINLTIDMHTQTDGVSHWLFNTEPYTTPDNTPSLFVALAAGSNATSPNTYTHQTQPYILSHNAVIEVIMKNKHMRPHPVHLHGHNFQVIHRSGKGTIEDTPVGTSPLRRDTVVINNHGTLRIRFRADNPGVWLFHCHMEWHSHSGLVATFVEAPLELQAQMGDKLMIGPNPELACDAPERIYKFNQNADSAAGAEAQQASRTLLGM
ncbi:hypothetical protein LTS08_000646 [Lithohypha guttulata]|nr:hypothetical protein LTS08_000646 [Lithohypha guttulata]